MSTYKRGGVWWYKFEFQGATIRESTGLTDREAAREREGERHNDLRKGRANIHRRAPAPLFSVAADDYLKAKRGDWAVKTAVIETTNLAHLKAVFGKKLLTDITAADVRDYRDSRKLAGADGRKGASDKTVSLEIGSLRGILLHHDLDGNWRAIKKAKLMKKARNIGRAITYVEEAALLRECRASRSRSLHVAVVVALQTCMRYSEIRLLQWRQVDLGRRLITVGLSKTLAGEGRVIPLTAVAAKTLTIWAGLFPDRKPNHYVFPSEQYGQGRDGQKVTVYGIDPTKSTDWKESWESAKLRAGVECRFHDLRHSGCSRLLDAGVSHPVVAEIMGWSASTAIRMIKEVYGHIGLAAKQRAMEQVELAARKTRTSPRVGTKVGTVEEPKVFLIQ